MASAVLIKSIGCRTNQEEMTALAAQLAGDGYYVVYDLADADVAIVNSCLVTSAAEAKTRRYISSVSHAYPGVRICVTGCLAQHSPHEILKRMPVTWVVGNSRKHDIPAILRKKEGGVFHGAMDAHALAAVSLVNSPTCPGASGRTRFFLKIQEGCNYRCAYCIVPLVRGPSRSVSFDRVVGVFEDALRAGYKEIVLTGTHIGQYSDGPSCGLEALVERLANTDGDFRVRLSSLDPRDMSDSLLQMIGSHPRLCRHLHLSVQSLSPAVLKNMGRPIAEHGRFLEKLASFRKSFPLAGLGGDFITGFPGETNEQFDGTCRAAVECGFTFGHVFRYSCRPGTLASAMPGQIDEKEKSRRSERLRKLLEDRRRLFVRSAAGEVQRVLVEEESPAAGLASNYLRIEVAGHTAPANTWIDVTVSGIGNKKDRCGAVLAKS
ncbi:MAG TPA: tRNA (N(6)-L-threonylcarbamoyladenosine(37)-C(2))-methylthiotransferase MtaB [Chitinivibrionales bacterium]|nr:tRNA (N(6)-L-threonylcarbamoyladenosine(37)-C(2))-methylthiotransferase MtaB [Chitinivibrionales bacterium]